MNRKDSLFATLLALLAVGIWMSDRAWIPMAGDTLPALLGFVAFVGFGKNWKFRTEEFHIETSRAVGGAIVLCGGIAFASNLLLALGWTLLLWAWLSSRLEQRYIKQMTILLTLPLLSFPWLALDGQVIGWWFRLTGAMAVEALCRVAGFEVHREGVQFLAQGLPVQLTPACSGLNALQSLLLAGSYLAYSSFGATRRYLWNLALLVGLAWVANTLRIVLLCVVGLSTSAETAMGAIHPISGMISIAIMFGLSQILFSLQLKSQKTDGVENRETFNGVLTAVQDN